MTPAAIPVRLWVYRARLERVIDGDTLDVTIDRGEHLYSLSRLRLLDVNAPEVHGTSRPAGDAATAYVLAWLQPTAGAADPWPLVLQTERSDVFGRYLTTVWRVSDGACLNADLLTSGHAVPFHER